MAVSLTGSRMSMTTIRSLLIAVGTACGLAFYLYGPVVTPMMHAAAVSSCNETTGGSFRGYHLEWTMSARPHWDCWDLSDPERPAMNMGWWVTPGR